MKLAVAWGLLVPLLGTSLGAACVFFLKKGLGGPGAAGAHRLRLRRHGGRIHLEPADPCYGAVHRCGDLGLFAGCNRLLGRDPLPVGARSPDLPSPPAEPAGRGTPHPVGVVYAGFLAGEGQITMTAALTPSLGIAIQNFPEGAIISMPLRSEGVGKARAFAGGVLSGAVEPLGALLTILAAGLVIPALPYLLSFTAGAML